LQSLLGAGRKIDAALLDEVEEILLTADIGVKTATTIIDHVKIRVKKEGLQDASKLYDYIKEEMLNLLTASPSAQNDALFIIPEENRPSTIMVIGVNGAGKTTSIGKLAHNYKERGYQTLIGAADTFRAAANEQLEVWAQRAGVDIITQHQGADPAAVAFDTLKAAQSRNADVVIIDTAGRLHNKEGLMKELEKISRVMKKLKESAPDEVFLVLDATTGQNAIQQAKEFMKVAPVTGIILTKLDGTAKGGVVIAIASEFKIPVRYIGVGEKITDLQPFDPVAFVEALFRKPDEEAPEATTE
jgi:fused signal recognition particle receptor